MNNDKAIEYVNVPVALLSAQVSFAAKGAYVMLLAQSQGILVSSDTSLAASGYVDADAFGAALQELVDNGFAEVEPDDGTRQLRITILEES